MQKQYPRWVHFLYGPYLKVIGFFYRTYTANRARFARITSGKRVAAFMRFLAILVLFAWILIWLFASEESRTRLVDDFKQSIGGMDTLFDK